MSSRTSLTDLPFMRESSESTLPFSLSERRRIAPLTSPTKTKLLNLRARLSEELDDERCDLRRDCIDLPSLRSDRKSPFFHMERQRSKCLLISLCFIYQQVSEEVDEA